MSTAAHRRPVPDERFGGRLRDCFLLDLEVVTTADHPPLRTITFRSADLVDFEWQPGQDLMFDVPGADRPVRRRYTIRRADPVAGTLDVDVVLHGSGPFARWATDATPGTRIEAIGPRGQITVRDDAAHHLFVGDASAIPVAFVMVEALSAEATATVIVAIDDPGDLPVPVTDARLDLRWVAEREVADVLDAVALPTGTVAYLNGERGLVNDTAARLGARGLADAAMTTKAYWRRDASNADHGEPGRE